MSWKNEVSEIKKRLRLIQQMGGKDKIKRQHDAGRTTVRERILSLLDKNSCLLYTSPSPRDAHESRMPSSA